MKQETLEKRVEYIAFLHKQNLNGRETEDELFEAGILAGIEETEEIMYSEEEFKEMVYHMVGALAHANNMTFNGAILDELFNKFKKEKQS